MFTAADQDANIYAATYIKFLLLSGVRKSEGLAAKWYGIQVVSGRRVRHIPHTKSSKSRHVILSAMAIDIWKALPRIEGNPYLFPGRVPGNPIQNPIKAFKRTIKHAGIESTFRLHDLRHTTALLIISKGGSLYDVQATSDNLSSVVAGAIGGESALVD